MIIFPMAATEEFRFPILIIKQVTPLLSKGEKTFAYKINAITENEEPVTFYENKGLDLSEYIGMQMQCLLEITRGNFYYLERVAKKSQNTIAFTYQWQKRLFEYFPDLVKLKDEHDDANDAEESSKQDLFETTACRIFNDWGLNGLDIGIYQAKPLLASRSGFFFLNEYEFEEEVDLLELDEKVYIQIDEIYLRGIRPYLPDGKEFKQKARMPEQEKPEPENSAAEPKKSRFSFLA